METLLGIIMTVLPLLIVAVLVVFVIKRLAKKAKEEGFTHTDNQRAVFMPFGMLIGMSVGILLGMFLPASMGTVLTLGSGFGFFFGYLLFEWKPQKETSM
ncbi:hypothetical protein JCM19037_4076 [Geomicrobium sp. JCM 19037]|uniref:hypothetical protein n=1 Tax=Geomicrobium sp. JCM 19037 TaxID=1460634 RepID=UPI00045F3A19|nr:hypothetical protein [Geomicrobium sp. JCM 19037]GAK05567.1 hypothetical protein JCM19037_4076 [Geomicrobium sp. JCM 19037]